MRDVHRRIHLLCSGSVGRDCEVSSSPRCGDVCGSAMSVNPAHLLHLVARYLTFHGQAILKASLAEAARERELSLFALLQKEKSLRPPRPVAAS